MSRSIALAKVAYPDDEPAESDESTTQEPMLIARAGQGDRAACDLLMRRYQRPVFAVALRYLKDPEEARDVAQRTFLQVFQQLGKFRGESSLRTWIYRITVNKALDAVRQRRRGPPLPEAPEPVAALGADRLIGAETGQRLRAAVSTLPPRQRLVVELRLLDDLPFREVAQVVGCSEEAAKVNFHHAVRRLRQVLLGEGGIS